MSGLLVILFVVVIAAALGVVWLERLDMQARKREIRRHAERGEHHIDW